MLIEAAKGGHANVACLLIDTQLQHSNYLPPDNPVHAGFPSPVSSSAPANHSSYHMCQHIEPSEHLHHMHQHECQFQCPHVQMPQQPQMQPDCFGHNCTFVPPVIQPLSIPNNSYNLAASLFDGEPFKQDVDVNTSPTGQYSPNIPVSLATQLSLANLTPADLQSLAQALSFSSSVNSAMQQDQLASPTSVMDNLGIKTNITFPVVDPQVESFTTQSEVCTPSPSDTTTALVTSAGRTITSTGVQTEDAISMIQKLTNSVHQLNALQSFAAAHNLELVNLGEITLPPAPFSLDGEQEDDGIMVADSAKTLEDSMAAIPREG